ncbi:MAG: biotin--[acetyl-CoA-carboxylase] ligase [Clostridiales bacterium]|jgi:BirA family biotin operon repressor/biotin-[acetyl-CoA-carboxylase] ligase|nr:biotin--[acetyl-CoA-carboxylase] ligase [Clostridiales bacterium]
MNNTARILKKLIEADGRFVSGAELGAELNVSRMTVSNCISELRGLNYNIASATNRGYSLSVPADALDGHILSVKLPDLAVVYFADTESTNASAKLKAAAGEFETLIVAGSQASGHGRRGRPFSSETGGAYFSYIYKPAIPCECGMLLTLAAGLAVAGAITALGIKGVGLKYPNDVYVSGKKVCGILTETASDGDTFDWAVTGIGINVNNKLPAEISGIAAALYEFTAAPLGRADIIRSVITRFCGLRALYAVDLLAAYAPYDILFGAEINIIKDNAATAARALGLDERGYLRAEVNGVVELVSGADVTVRRA